MRLALLFLSTLSLGLAGCYPALRTVQPRAHFIVLDESGAPLVNATVTVAIHRMPFASARGRTLVQLRTDAAGQASLSAKRAWETQILLPDGGSWYSWIYCIDRPGYQPAISVQPDFSKPVIATLARSDKSLVCRWPTDNEAYHHVIATES